MKTESNERSQRQAPWGFAKWTDALRSTVAMNGAGVAAILALMQVFPKGLLWLSLCSLPFTAGLFVSLYGWVFTFVGPDESDERHYDVMGSVAWTAIGCIGCFVVGAASTTFTATALAITPQAPQAVCVDNSN